MKKRIFVILLIGIVTNGCIYLGIRSRYNARLKTTQFAGEGNGYLIETQNNNLIIIDGGTKNDAKIIEDTLASKENLKISAWFLTSVANDNIGALCNILQNYKNIDVENIYISFNSGEFYDNSDLSQEELQELHENLDILYSNENIGKLREIERRVPYKFDNCYITALEVKNEEQLSSNDIYNQTVILKLDNTFKSMIFLGNIGDEKAHYFLENNQDELKCDILQFSGNKLNEYGKEIFEKIKPKIVMVSSFSVPEFVKADIIYKKSYGQITCEL